MNKHYNISGLKFEGNFLFLTINGEKKKFPLREVSLAIEQATDEQKNTYEISPSGYGIHWPLIDEDVFVGGLLGVVNHPEIKRKIA